MFDFIKNLDGIYYVLWGIGAFGLLMKIFANTYLKGLLRASENMATTKRKFLRVMRQKYENGKSMGLRTGGGQAFVEKNVRSVKFIFLPIEIYSKLGRILLCPLCIVLGASFLIYDVSWRGSPGMLDLFANGIMVGAFLLMFENIFLINNKLEILKANIKDYFDNCMPKRELIRRQKISPETAAATEVIEPNVARRLKREVYENEIKEDNKNGQIDETKNEINDRQSEEILNSFLREFFS